MQLLRGLFPSLPLKKTVKQNLVTCGIFGRFRAHGVLRGNRWVMYFLRGIFPSLVLNKTPKGIKRSEIPLPCYFDVVKSRW